MSIRPILQSEIGECGLACLSMVAKSFGIDANLRLLRSQFGSSLKGATLKQLVSHAELLGMNARPVRAALHELKDISLPCIIHWNLNHFVVLEKIGRRSATIVDPASGRRKLSIKQLSSSFTGIALELTLRSQFSPPKKQPTLSLRALTGPIVGLRRSLTHIFFVALLLETLVIVAPLLQQIVVDEVIASGDVDFLTVLVLGFGLMLILQTSVSILRSNMLIHLGQTIFLQWATNVFSHLLRLDISFFEKRHLGDISSRFSSIQAIQKTLTTSAIEAMLDGLMAIVALVMMALYSKMLAAVTLSSVAIYALLRCIAYGPFRDAAAERLVLAARENTHFLESVRAILPLKLFNRESDRQTRWSNLVVEVQNRDVRTARMTMGFSAANSFIAGVENLLVIWLGGQLVLNSSNGDRETFTVGMLFAYISYKTQFSSRLSKLVNFAVEVKMLGLHTERLSDIVLETREDSEVKGSSDHLEPSIELKGVSFRYGDDEPWILKNVSLKIGAGENVVVIGPSGAGKTTLLKIALGLIQPIEGSVYYGGVAVEKLGLANARKHFGSVMQDDVLLAGSIAENVSFFDVEPHLENIEKCVTLAELRADIQNMPMGLQTQLGDLGRGLSGGQRQRLLLARALYKSPKVLALDEATSHLDVTTERLIAKRLAELNVTRLSIAHRPETIAAAKRVIQVVNGQVIESETHRSHAVYQ